MVTLTAFHSSKGGVGKTNIALNYAGYVVAELEKIVWFIELDWSLGNALSSFSYLRPPISVSEYVLGKRASITDCLFNATSFFEKNSRENGLFVALVTEEPEDRNAIRQRTFSVRSDESMLLRLIGIEETARKYEEETGIPIEIIFDSTAGIDPMAMEAATLASRVVMVSRSSRIQYQEISTVVGILRNVKLDLGQVGLVINQVPGKPKDPRIIELLREAQETSTIPVIGIMHILNGFEDSVYTFGDRPEQMKIDPVDAYVARQALMKLCKEIGEFS
ncbi:MAG: hypothetical protein ACXACI_15450 [Candidatus Hodarchaeales archaeon]|jgi:MinD-like ATPase involved in chromosome partitioning or flagellar assembly